jgi:hypothetical protein
VESGDARQWYGSMIPFIAASGLIVLGLVTWKNPNTRSWVFITLGFIMVLDEALEGHAKRHAAGNQFTLVRRALATVFAAIIVLSVFL